MNEKLAKRIVTSEKRKTQTCKVYDVKIDRSHLSKSTEKKLSLLFKEAKWFYNYCLSHENINGADYKVKSVPVKVKNEWEERKFSILQSQHRQAIKDRTFTSLKTLSKTKKNGKKVGKLKFKSDVNSIPLKQYEFTHQIDFDKNRIKLAGIKKKWLKVNGLDQIPKDVEIANAHLVKKCNDFYLHITTFQDKQEVIRTDTSIGIDFGCDTQLTFSNGIKVEFQVSVNKKIKRLDRKISNETRKNSKKKEQDKRKRKKEYERLTNRRKDIRCKLVNAITTNYKYVCFQDENIHAWMAGNHGKKINSTGIGGIISDLKHKSHTPIMVDKFFPSTQLCPSCGERYKPELKDRVYTCENCGYTNDRDVKSAICIETEGIKLIPMDHREFTAMETLTSTFFNKLVNINVIKVSKSESSI